MCSFLSQIFIQPRLNNRSHFSRSFNVRVISNTRTSWHVAKIDRLNLTHVRLQMSFKHAVLIRGILDGLKKNQLNDFLQNGNIRRQLINETKINRSLLPKWTLTFIFYHPMFWLPVLSEKKRFEKSDTHGNEVVFTGELK